MTVGLPDSLYFSYIAVDDDDPLSVWVTCSGFLEGQKVFHSPDGGDTWENVSYNLPNIPANTIVHQNGSDENIVYIGTDAGIYYTWDDHGAWELYSTDLPNVLVSELEIHYSTGKIYAATFGRGIWMADLASASSSSRFIDDVSKLDVYPNPSSGSLFIEYAGLPVGIMTVDVVDIQGKVVYSESVSNEAGQGKVKIEPAVRSGVYFIRIKAGNTLRSSRVIID